jgi:hypothetical protein
VFTSQDVIVSSSKLLNTPRHRDFYCRLRVVDPSRKFAWHGELSSFVASKKGQPNHRLDFHNDIKITTQYATNLHSNSFNIRNGSQTQRPRAHTLLNGHDTILLHSNGFCPYNCIKGISQVEQQPKSTGNCTGNMAELFGHNAAEDQAD